MSAYKKFHLRVQNPKDAGIACLKSILNYFGADASFEQLRKLSGSSQKELSFMDLLRTGRSLGLKGKGYKLGIEFLKKQQNPTILHVIKNKISSSFIVCYRYDKKTNKFWIGDPELGKLKAYSVEQLNEIWVSKCLLTFESSENLEKIKAEESLKSRGLKNLIQSDTNTLLAVFILGLIIAVLGLGEVIFLQQLIDNILPAQLNSTLFLATALLVVLILFRRGLNYIQQFFLLRQSKDLYCRVNEVFFKVISTDTSFQNRDKIQQLRETVGVINQFQSRLVQILNSIFRNTSVLLIGLLAIGIFSWQIGLLTLIGTGFLIFLILKTDPQQLKSPEAVFTADSKISRFYSDTMENYDLISTESKFEFISTILKECFELLYQRSLFEWKKWTILKQFSLSMISIFIVSSIMLFTTVQLMGGTLSLGKGVAILQLLFLVFFALVGLAKNYIESKAVKAVFKPYYDNPLIDAVLGQDYPSNEDKINHFKTLEVKHLAFGFQQDKPIFRDANFHVYKGEIIVISGASGSGKSTFLELLLRSYPIHTGELIVNGEKLDHFSTKEWLKHLGVVRQRIKFFGGSLIHNIFLEEPLPAPVIQQQFIKEHGFHPYFKHFPNAYQTIIGKNGECISAGQQQLVALARALWKKPSLLLLDEPTAAMDRNTEGFVMELLTKVKDRMGIVIFTNKEVLSEYATRTYCIKEGTLKLLDSSLEIREDSTLYSSWSS